MQIVVHYIIFINTDIVFFLEIFIIFCGICYSILHSISDKWLCVRITCVQIVVHYIIFINTDMLVFLGNFYNLPWYML